MAATLDPFARGDTLNLKFTFTDKVTGAVVDITGWEIWITLKDNETDADPGVLQVKYVVPAGADATAGIARPVITNTETAIPVKTYYYDIQRVIPGSPPDVQTVTKSRVKVLQDITLSTA